MDRQRSVKLKKILTIILPIMFIIWAIVNSLTLFGVLNYRDVRFLSWGLLGGIIILIFARNYLNSLFHVRVVKFFCPKCEQYASRPRNHPNCPNCDEVMYPVRYCPKCQVDDTVVSLTQWRCYRCGSKLKEIASIVETEQGEGKEAV